jgi:hypothetical protein
MGSDDEEEWYEQYPVLHVPFVDDAVLQPTGLLDSDGVPLWRVPPPIGFGRDTEW